MSTMKIKAIAPWFGNNRAQCDRVGREMGTLAWAGVPFCGGMPELPGIKCREGLASDLHRHVINLARVVREPTLCDLLQYRLEGSLFHPDELAAAQALCIARGGDHGGGLFQGQNAESGPDVDWAAAYFVCCWMGRGGHAGKTTEFGQGLAVRYTSSGGGSAKRFHSAVAGLKAWHQALARWQFERVDCFNFLDRVRDQDDHGLYLDPPWPDLGIEYRHGFTEAQHRKLAGKLAEFEHARIVLRYGDHPLIRHLYPEGRWTWVRSTTTNQTGGEVSEVLIVNGPSYTEGKP